MMNRRSRSKKSRIWEYYHDKPGMGGTVLVCNTCGHAMARHQKSTSNLIKHLKSKHPSQAKAFYDHSRLDSFGLAIPEPQSSSILGQPNPIGKRKVEEVTHDQNPPKLSKGFATDDTNTSTSPRFRTDPVLAASITNQIHRSRCRDVVKDSNRAKKSVVWKYFSDVIGTSNARCHLCSMVIKHCFGTSPLRRHLARKHPTEAMGFEDEVIIANDSTTYTINIEDDETIGEAVKSFEVSTPAFNALPNQNFIAETALPSQSALEEACQSQNLVGPFDSVKPRDSGSSMDLRQKLLDKKIIAMMALDLQPPSIVECKGFRELIAALDPQYNLPDRKTVTSRLLPNLFKKTVNEVSKTLGEANYIALSTDFWTLRDQESYLSITAHFTCPTKWTLQSLMLSTTVFYGNPVGQDISKELQRVVSEWKISDKITVMVADNETNILLANEQLPWAYIPCLGHLIHVVVTEALSTESEGAAVIEKVHDIVNFFKSNPEAKETLRVTAASMELPLRKLILEVPMRWNSTFHMLEVVNEQIDAINAVLEMSNMGEKTLSEYDGNVMKAIISSLKPFQAATTTLSADTSKSTISVAMPLIKGLLRMMMSEKEPRGALTESLIEGLKESFGKTEEIEWILAATFLDPRFKKLLNMEEEILERAKQIITIELTKMVGSKQADDDNVLPKNETSSTSTTAVEDSFWQYLDSMTNACHEAQEMPTEVNLEIQYYIGLPPIPRSECPFHFWKQHLEFFPNLHKLALKYLAVPISSVSPSNLFSKAGDELRERRSLLKPKNVNMILFLNKNL